MTNQKALKEAFNVHLLPITFPSGAAREVIYPVLIEAGAHKILVDCGYPGFAPFIEEALVQAGTTLAGVTDVVITHHDLDHVGALYEIMQAHPGIRVHASAQEALFVNGSQKAPRLLQAEALLDQLPDDQKTWALAFQAQLENIRAVEVPNSLGEDAESWKGVQTIATPGHTPGHISLYLPAQKTLIAADAVVYVNGKLDIANPEYTLDLPQAVESVRKIAALGADRLICYHGGMVENPEPLLVGLLQRYAAGENSLFEIIQR